MLRYRSGTYFCASLLKWEADDGLCAIDITNKKGEIYDVSTGDELSRATAIVLDLCVKSYLQKGGVAIGIGEQGHWRR